MQNLDWTVGRLTEKEAAAILTAHGISPDINDWMEPGFDLARVEEILAAAVNEKRQCLLAGK